ncbi:MAG: hypothetical protein E7020_00725 [Alphaproteobacteria bacterium]|nr:hypothetical protein [Alphaproteobacteria bacterium]
MEKGKNPLQTYAIVDASAPAEVLQEVESVISIYGRRIRRGFVLTPHGVNKIIFFEVKKKHCQIVDVLAKLAEMYDLYPMYVMQEGKCHLPKNPTETKWYLVDEVKMTMPVMTEEEFEQFKSSCMHVLKERYREDHVFIKLFVYRGKYGVVHVMAFNSERDPLYTGMDIGVPGWKDAMVKVEAEFKTEEVQRMCVRYTNL